MGEIDILIVEDELLIAKGLARKLKKLGYQVMDIVASGEEAIHYSITHKPDLILMDIVLEGEMDGIEAAEKINEFQSIPIIYLTAYADDATLIRAEETNYYGYLLKPCKERELYATIKMAFKKWEDDQVLRQSLAIANAKNEEKSRYLSLTSHDLRNPLTTIQVSAEMLKDYGDKLTEEKKQKHLDWIRSSVKNINTLLEDILTLNQADAGKLSFEPQPVNVVELSESIVHDFEAIATDEHKIIFKPSEPEIMVDCDIKLLYHILGNLLSNAIKYSPDGGTITLDLSRSAKEVIFTVKDQGIGFPPDYQAKLFTQFERASNVGSIKGTGLGLSIVKYAVECHGGTISLSSEEGVGTTAIFTLPSLPPVPVN
ncbi:hybrid sensor histidine kinase/response regulator [Roseofilum capinflatum]|uniref:histidine kinase n=1 Tax=Roseofilum capinflatum BLCC-M114 TaxID=3022440 RepID=A0ABT7B778_9CYAN|nr:ATP-binding protein [Roseofilum capinflatum]MDJ1175022.1 ATP-binding protein [Roseofilum capinflatum BLCC-M114]